MLAVSGTYILILHSHAASRIRVGRLGYLDMQPGWYLYIGSAFGSGGVRARVGRHARINKGKRWHIDYLRARCRLAAVWYSYDGQPRETQWASMLAGCLGYAIPMVGFGASDSPATSHLFYSRSRPSFRKFRQLVAELHPGHAAIHRQFVRSIEAQDALF